MNWRTSPAAHIARLSRCEKIRLGFGGYGEPMATNKAPQPVVVEPRPGGKWAVQRDKGQRASSVHDKKQPAINAARQIAKNQGAELVVKGENGRIQSKDSHGRDSGRSKG